MKAIKLISCILVMVVMAFTVNAQVRLSPSKSYYSYIGVATDTVRSHASGSWSQEIYPQKPYPVKIDFSVKLERSVTTTFPKLTVKVQGKKFDSDATWTDVTSMTVTVPASGKGLSSDSTINLSQTTTAQFYRYFRVLLTGVAVTDKPAVKVAFTKWRFYQ